MHPFFLNRRWVGALKCDKVGAELAVPIMPPARDPCSPKDGAPVLNAVLLLSCERRSDILPAHLRFVVELATSLRPHLSTTLQQVYAPISQLLDARLHVTCRHGEDEALVSYETEYNETEAA